MSSVTGLSKIENGENLPAPVLQRWAAIESAKFRPEKAKQCLAVTQGAWLQISPTDAQKAIALDTPTIGAISFYMGQETAVQVLCEMIAATAAILNVGKNIRKEQIILIAQVLFDDNKLMTVADWRACLRMGATGRFGINYDRLDIEVLSTWQRTYWEQRLAISEGNSNAKTKEDKSAPVEWRQMPDWFRDWVKEFTKKTEEKKPFEPDAVMLAFWRSEWEALPEPRPKWETFVEFQKKKLIR